MIGNELVHFRKCWACGEILEGQEAGAISDEAVPSKNVDDAIAHLSLVIQKLVIAHGEKGDISQQIEWEMDRLGEGEHREREYIVGATEHIEEALELIGEMSDDNLKSDNSERGAESHNE